MERSMETPEATADASFSTVPEDTKWVVVERGMLSRVLYANPVCLLTTRDAETHRENVMTITWLTPINNQGGFICSMNCHRHSAQFVNRVGAVFVLNVPTAGMEALVLSIGGCSGASVDKFTAFDLASCAPGGGAVQSPLPIIEDAALGLLKKKPKLSKQELHRRTVDAAAAQTIALRDCVAHVLCRVTRVEQDDGHWLLRCTQLAAWCRDGYWDGKQFMPQRSDAPPFLTFLGSKAFGYVRHTPPSEVLIPETEPATNEQ